MREHFAGIALFAALAALIPFLALDPRGFPPNSAPAQPAEQTAAPSDNTQDKENLPASKAQEGQDDASGTAVDEAQTPLPQPPKTEAPVVDETGRLELLDASTGKHFSVTTKEYVRGALAAEMPPTFHTEALKAQAVAAHTYALCVQRMQEQAPDPALDGAVLAVDPDNWKTYTTEKLFRERYGNMADAYWKSIANAADAVCDYVMVYDGEPIVAAYHSMNTGKTEDASHVWTGSAPYLTPVESRGDMLAPDYKTEQSFPAETVRKALQKAYPEITLDEDPAAWLRLGERSDSGYVLTVRAGEREIPAKELRTLLDLRSTAFDLSYKEGTFRFTVRGYGHGVGLSQYGADWYARQGMDFAEILEHYYPGARLGLARRANI